jgi:hypothetical protein
MPESYSSAAPYARAWLYSEIRDAEHGTPG